MFERFTDSARRAVVLAQEEARQLMHAYIGTEHLLLAIVREGESPAAAALRLCGIGPDQLPVLVAGVEELVGRGSLAPTGHMPFTPRLKKVLEHALREAMKRGDNYIGAEHLLLGLVAEAERNNDAVGVGWQLLSAQGATTNAVRLAVANLSS